MNRSPNEGSAHSKLEPAERLLRQLECITSGQYTVVGHPVYDEPDDHQFGNEEYPAAKVAVGQGREWLMFTDPRVIDACRRLGVQPIRYDEADRVGE